MGGRRVNGANARWNVLLPHGLILLGSSAEKVDDALSCMDSRYISVIIIAVGRVITMQEQAEERDAGFDRLKAHAMIPSVLNDTAAIIHESFRKAREDWIQGRFCVKREEADDR